MSKLIPPFLRDAAHLLKRDTYKYKCSFAMLGTVGSGKTTAAGFMVTTAITMSASNPGFVCDVIESKSGILEAQSLLRRGRFPEKTDPLTPVTYESGLLMRWSSSLRKREMHLPICDVAGEVVAALAQKYREGEYACKDETFSETKFLIEQLQDRDGFILTIPASRAFMFQDDLQLEAEPSIKREITAEKKATLGVDPDVNLSYILEAIIDYKRKTTHHPIQGIAVIVTKYDMVKDICKREDMDLYDESGLGFRNFMNTCFPATANKLRFFGLENVAFFPSEVGLAPDPWPDGKPRIEILRRRPDDTPCRVPKYPERQYERLINYLSAFAA